MMDFYFFTTDNGYKGRMAMEESGLSYKLHLVNLRAKEQFNPEFMKISPGHKIPALYDPEGPGGPVTIAESGAILKYVSQKSQNGLYPSLPAQRVKVDQWLFYGSATYTTLAQQFGHWVIRSPDDNPGAKKFYTDNYIDMLGILDRHLADHEYFADQYSVADISMFPDTHLHGVNDIGLKDFPNVQRWHDAIWARPATQRAWGPHE
jgi:GST-like protein